MAYDDKYSSVYDYLAEALGRLDNYPGIIQALIKLLDDSQEATRLSAVQAISDIGPIAIKAAFNKLENMIEYDPSVDVFWLANNTLRE
jgi:HEAT repeat protein